MIWKIEYAELELGKGKEGGYSMASSQLILLSGTSVPSMRNIREKYQKNTMMTLCDQPDIYTVPAWKG